VRASVTDEGSGAQCWLRVDRPGVQQGFFENMNDRPVRTPAWSTVEIVGRIDLDAERIALGCFLKGVGLMTLDEIHLSVKEPSNAWTTIEIKNPGFEESDERQPANGWSNSGLRYSYRVGAERFKGERSLLISTPRLPEGHFNAIGWSSDGKQIYALDAARHIVAIPVAGGDPKTIGIVPLPEDRRLGEATITPDGRRLAFTVLESKSDVWIIDNFDPSAQ